MATLNSREKIQERARKHTRNVWGCPICKKKCRGNGGKASHQRMHVKKAGYDDDDIFGWGLRALFRRLWREGPHPDGLRSPPAWTRNLAAEEWTYDPVDRSGSAQYVLLIRAPDDPTRQDRAHSLGGKTDGPTKIADLKALAKVPVETWRKAILGCLVDGVARTFNRIGVELCDRTADMLLDTNAEKALWELVASHHVEHTMHAPILFRKTTITDEVREAAGIVAQAIHALRHEAPQEEQP